MIKINEDTMHKFSKLKVVKEQKIRYGRWDGSVPFISLSCLTTLSAE